MPIYFDNAATTRPFDSSIEKFLKTQRDFYFNPSSLHAGGAKSKQFLNEQRKLLAESLGIDLSYYDIVFTSSSTEGNNIVIQSLLKKSNSAFLTTSSEHASVASNRAILESTGHGYFETPMNFGFVNVEKALAKVVKNPNISLLSFSYISNQTGAVNDIPYIAKEIKKINPKILFHSDCTQAMNEGIDFGKFQEVGVDYMTSSSHKSYAPAGCGLLILKKGLKPSLSVAGGQEGGVRGGTEALPLIAAYVESLCKLKKEGEKYRRHLHELKSRLRDGLEGVEGFYFIEGEMTKNQARGEKRSYSDAISLIGSRHYPSEVLLRILSDKGFYLSASSACHSNAKSSRAPLVALGFAKFDAERAVRLSLGYYNTIEEVDEFIKILRTIG